MPSLETSIPDNETSIFESLDLKSPLEDKNGLSLSITFCSTPFAIIHL